MKLKLIQEAEGENVLRIRQQIKDLERMNIRYRMNINALTKASGDAKPDQNVINKKRDIKSKIKQNNEKINSLRKQVKSMKESHKMSLGKSYRGSIK